MEMEIDEEEIEEVMPHHPPLQDPLDEIIVHQEGDDAFDSANDEIAEDRAQRCVEKEAEEDRQAPPGTSRPSTPPPRQPQATVASEVKKVKRSSPRRRRASPPRPRNRAERSRARSWNAERPHRSYSEGARYRWDDNSHNDGFVRPQLRAPRPTAKRGRQSHPGNPRRATESRSPRRQNKRARPETEKANSGASRSSDHRRVVVSRTDQRHEAQENVAPAPAGMGAHFAPVSTETGAHPGPFPYGNGAIMACPPMNQGCVYQPAFPAPVLTVPDVSDLQQAAIARRSDMEGLKVEESGLVSQIQATEEQMHSWRAQIRFSQIKCEEQEGNMRQLQQCLQDNLARQKQLQMMDVQSQGFFPMQGTGCGNIPLGTGIVPAMNGLRYLFPPAPVPTQQVLHALPPQMVVPVASAAYNPVTPQPAYQPQGMVARQRFQKPAPEKLVRQPAPVSTGEQIQQEEEANKTQGASPLSVLAENVEMIQLGEEVVSHQEPPPVEDAAEKENQQTTLERRLARRAEVVKNIAASRSNNQETAATGFWKGEAPLTGAAKESNGAKGQEQPGTLEVQQTTEVGTLGTSDRNVQGSSSTAQQPAPKKPTSRGVEIVRNDHRGEGYGLHAYRYAQYTELPNRFGEYGEGEEGVLALANKWIDEIQVQDQMGREKVPAKTLDGFPGSPYSLFYSEPRTPNFKCVYNFVQVPIQGVALHIGKCYGMGSKKFERFAKMVKAATSFVEVEEILDHWTNYFRSGDKVRRAMHETGLLLEAFEDVLSRRLKFCGDDPGLRRARDALIDDACDRCWNEPTCYYYDTSRCDEYLLRWFDSSYCMGNPIGVVYRRVAKRLLEWHPVERQGQSGEEATSQDGAQA